MNDTASIFRLFLPLFIFYRASCCLGGKIHNILRVNMKMEAEKSQKEKNIKNKT